MNEQEVERKLNYLQELCKALSKRQLLFDDEIKKLKKENTKLQIFIRNSRQLKTKET